MLKTNAGLLNVMFRTRDFWRKDFYNFSTESKHCFYSRWKTKWVRKTTFPDFVLFWYFQCYIKYIKDIKQNHWFMSVDVANHMHTSTSHKTQQGWKWETSRAHWTAATGVETYTETWETRNGCGGCFPAENEPDRDRQPERLRVGTRPGRHMWRCSANSSSAGPQRPPSEAAPALHRTS